jgi:hypothetical protein
LLHVINMHCGSLYLPLIFIKITKSRTRWVKFNTKTLKLCFSMTHQNNKHKLSTLALGLAKQSFFSPRVKKTDKRQITLMCNQINQTVTGNKCQGLKCTRFVRPTSQLRTVLPHAAVAVCQPRNTNSEHSPNCRTIASYNTYCVTSSNNIYCLLMVI